MQRIHRMAARAHGLIHEETALQRRHIIAAQHALGLEMQWRERVFGIGVGAKQQACRQEGGENTAHYSASNAVISGVSTRKCKKYQIVKTTTRMPDTSDGPAAAARPSAITSSASTKTRNRYKNPGRTLDSERSSQGNANSTASSAITPKMPPQMPGNTACTALKGTRYQGGVSIAGTISGVAAAPFSGFSPKCGTKNTRTEKISANTTRATKYCAV